MNETNTNNKVDKMVSYTVGTVSAIISLILAVGTIAIAAKIDFSGAKNVEIGVIILSIVLPFVLFFGVVAWRGLTPRGANQKELMSVHGWRVLAVLFLVIGVICSIYGHWATILLPGAMAFICMMKDRKFVEKLRAIGLLP